jgi:hypothetical protein
MDQIKPLFTATATAIGGRNGHTETSDGVVEANLSVPKAMGGPGKPESHSALATTRALRELVTPDREGTALGTGRWPAYRVLVSLPGTLTNACVA